MNLEEILDNDKIVTAISFEVDGIELTYLEKRHQKRRASKGQVIALEITEDDEELMVLYSQLQSIASDIIDHGDIYITRDPPQEIREERHPELPFEDEVIDVAPYNLEHEANEREYGD